MVAFFERAMGLVLTLLIGECVAGPDYRGVATVPVGEWRGTMKESVDVAEFFQMLADGLRSQRFTISDLRKFSENPWFVSPAYRNLRKLWDAPYKVDEAQGVVWSDDLSKVVWLEGPMFSGEQTDLSKPSRFMMNGKQAAIHHNEGFCQKDLVMGYSPRTQFSPSGEKVAYLHLSKVERGELKKIWSSEMYLDGKPTGLRNVVDFVFIDDNRFAIVAEAENFGFSGRYEIRVQGSVTTTQASSLKPPKLYRRGREIFCSIKSSIGYIREEDWLNPTHDDSPELLFRLNHNGLEMIGELDEMLGRIIVSPDGKTVTYPKRTCEHPVPRKTNNGFLGDGTPYECSESGGHPFLRIGKIDLPVWHENIPLMQPIVKVFAVSVDGMKLVIYPDRSPGGIDGYRIDRCIDRRRVGQDEWRLEPVCFSVFEPSIVPVASDRFLMISGLNQKTRRFGEINRKGGWVPFGPSYQTLGKLTVSPSGKRVAAVTTMKGSSNQFVVVGNAQEGVHAGKVHSAVLELKFVSDTELRYVAIDENDRYTGYAVDLA